MNKVTMKDIAKEAGVSVATVSYVLNNNIKEKIPEETRQRIMNIAKELNYVPNLAARSLVKRKSGLIGILISRDYDNEGEWKKCLYTEFISEIEVILSAMGYHILIYGIDTGNPNADIIAERELDGVFVIDVDKSFFYKISNKFTVPIIIIDSRIEDIIFHKILPDFSEALQLAKEYFEEEDISVISDKYNDKNITMDMKSSLGREDELLIVQSSNELENFIKNRKNKKLVIINEFLAIMACKYIEPSDLAVICTCGCAYLLPDGVKTVILDNCKKAEIAAEIILDYIDKNYHDNKYTYIKAE
ncbi:MAG: LacI family DNA-binding transcriptional regulator [Bacillota bacterium]|nr:LacI family DNA-binding transcriptional regulator [Bacillota bacterium]